MTNNELSALFTELADILELAGENYFKIRAYRQAAEIITSSEKNIAEIPPEKLLEMPGIGKAITEKIATAKANGTFPTLDKWRQTGYATILLLNRKDPLISIKILRKLIKEIGINSIDDLKVALFDGRIESSDKFDQETKLKIRELCK